MNDGASAVTLDQLRQELARFATREELARRPTREELREELARYPTREELRETLQSELARYPTREELRATKDELGQYIYMLAQRFDQAERTATARHETLLRTVGDMIDASERRLREDIARSARAAAEGNRLEIGALDDRYRGIPARVTTLEREVDEHRRDAAAHRPPRRPPR